MLHARTGSGLLEFLTSQVRADDDAPQEFESDGAKPLTSQLSNGGKSGDGGDGGAATAHPQVPALRGRRRRVPGLGEPAHKA